MRSAIESGVNALPSLRGTAHEGSVRLAKKMARSASLEPEDRFIRNCTYLDAGQKMSLYTAGVQHQLRVSDPAVRHHASFDAVRDADFLNQMLYLDTKIFMTSLNLELQRQNEHGVVSRSARPISRPATRRVCRLEYSAGFQAQRIFPAQQPSTFFARAMQTFCPPKCCASRKPASRLLSTTGWRTICARWWMTCFLIQTFEAWLVPSASRAPSGGRTSQRS